MSSETRDPRGAVLDAIIDEALDEYGEHDAYICKLDELLARLDAADPLRKLWPEVVEALETLVQRSVEQNGERYAYDRCRECGGTWWGPREGRDNPEPPRHNIGCVAAEAQRVLTRLDAADPVRKLWPEVLEALGEGLSALEYLWECHMDDRFPDMGRWNDAMKQARDLLTRAQALTPDRETKDAER